MTPDPIAKLASLRKAYSEKKVQTDLPKQVRVYEYQLSDSPSWLIYFTAGVELDAAEKSLHDKFGMRLIAVKERK